MKINNYSRKTLTAMTAFLLFLRICGPIHAKNLDPKLTKLAVAESSSAANDGRLIIARIPNLGNHVIVDLYIDGVATLPIVYGQTYQGLLSPGRHVLSVLASPNAKWKTPSSITLNVRKDETYYFTAMGDGSGHLILKTH